MGGTEQGGAMMGGAEEGGTDDGWEGRADGGLSCGEKYEKA